jgi:pilus assembly protein CpaF
MFTIIISEKGGAERREAFERNEINVGRVQGNDLMLPKGNVSKHHARLLFRDGRFIVTDLKSTNGTYVNGRKISQATIVREGDKIYIGDFVLRLETGQGVAPLDSVGDDSLVRASAGRISPVVREVSSSAPPQDAPTGVPPPPGPMMGGIGTLSAPPASPAHRSSPEQAVSHFPLERDPDSESAPGLHGTSMPRVPGPPRLPQAEGRPRAATAMLGVAAAPPSGGARTLARPTAQQAAHRKALISLVDRVAEVVDLAALDASAGADSAASFDGSHEPARDSSSDASSGGLGDPSQAVDRAVAERIDAAAQEQAKAMRVDGEAPETVDLEALARDALRELVGLGPLGPLLEDSQADEIHVPRPDAVFAVRDGHLGAVDPAFTSEEALSRVVARLARQSGEPLRQGEVIVDRRLPGGARMTAVAPPLVSGWTLTIRKPVRVEGSFEDLVRAAALSRSMATLLEACVAVRANVLVVGSGPGVVASMIAALAFASAAGDRIALVADAEEIQVAHAFVTRVSFAVGRAASEGANETGRAGPRGPTGGEEVLRAASRLRTDRLIVASLTGGLAAATVDAICDGSEGVVAGMSAPSLRHALARLVARVGLARAGTSLDVAREALAEAFDVAVEVARGADGRPRVTRLVELAGADGAGVIVRDLFQSSADGSGDGGFVATGATPRFLHDFAARGVKLDPALFKRR